MTPNIVRGSDGFFAWCLCGWISQIRTTYQVAAADQIDHRDKCEEAPRP
jgi:hypothetical protein